VDEIVTTKDPVEPNFDSIQSETEEEIEVTSVQPTRRSTRSTAGQASNYEPYSMFTQDYGMALANLRVKVALERFGKVAYDSIKDELEPLFVKKEALAPILLRDLARVNLYFPILRSHMFLREKFNALGVFEKIKARLFADGSSQDREDFDDTLKLVAVEKRHLSLMLEESTSTPRLIDRLTCSFSLTSSISFLIFAPILSSLMIIKVESYPD